MRCLELSVNQLLLRPYSHLPTSEGPHDTPYSAGSIRSESMPYNNKRIGMLGQQDQGGSGGTNKMVAGPPPCGPQLRTFPPLAAHPRTHPQGEPGPVQET